MKYVLVWWDSCDDMDGSKGPDGQQDLIGVTPDMVRKWFNIPMNEAPIHSYSVFEQYKEIQPYFTTDAFNFGRFDYYVEAESEFPGERVDCAGKTINESPSTI